MLKLKLILLFLLFTDIIQCDNLRSRTELGPIENNELKKSVLLEDESLKALKKTDDSYTPYRLLEGIDIEFVNSNNNHDIGRVLEGDIRFIDSDNNHDIGRVLEGDSIQFNDSNRNHEIGRKNEDEKSKETEKTDNDNGDAYIKFENSSNNNNIGRI